MKYLHYIGAGILWPVLFVVRVFLTLVGIPIVLGTLPFAKEYSSNREVSWSGWKLVRLPKWAWLWDNIRDGAMGDVRGKYWFVQAPKWADTPYLKMFNWLALRNPVNNFSRWMPIASVDCNGREIKVLSEGDKHQFLLLVGKWRIPYWHLRYNFYKTYVIKFGHKLDLKYNGRDWSDDPQKARRGFTFRIDW